MNVDIGRATIESSILKLTLATPRGSPVRVDLDDALKVQGDIRLLVRHIIRKFNERLKKNVSGITDEALAVLDDTQGATA